MSPPLVHNANNIQRRNSAHVLESTMPPNTAVGRTPFPRRAGQSSLEGGEGACRTEHGLLDHVDSQKPDARHFHHLVGRSGNRRSDDQRIPIAAYVVILTVPCTTFTLYPMGTSFVPSLALSVCSQYGDSGVLGLYIIIRLPLPVIHLFSFAGSKKCSFRYSGSPDSAFFPIYGHI